MSTPRSKGFKNNGVAHVLSMTVGMPALFAIFTIAGISWISKVLEPGDSKKISLVLSLIYWLISEPIFDSICVI